MFQNLLQALQASKRTLLDARRDHNDAFARWKEADDRRKVCRHEIANSRLPGYGVYMPTAFPDERGVRSIKRGGYPDPGAGQVLKLPVKEHTYLPCSVRIDAKYHGKSGHDVDRASVQKALKDADPRDWATSTDAKGWFRLICCTPAQDGRWVGRQLKVVITVSPRLGNPNGKPARWHNPTAAECAMVDQALLRWQQARIRYTAAIADEQATRTVFDQAKAAFVQAKADCNAAQVAVDAARAARPPEICRHFQRTGWCRHGTNCRYEHVHRGAARPLQQLCRNFHQRGNCRFGARCRFKH